MIQNVNVLSLCQKCTQQGINPDHWRKGNIRRHPPEKAETGSFHGRGRSGRRDAKGDVATRGTEWVEVKWSGVASAEQCGVHALSIVYCDTFEEGTDNDQNVITKERTS